MLGLIHSLVEAFPPDDDCPCWMLQGMADAEGCFVCCGGQKHVQTTDPLVPRLQVRSTSCTVASTMVQMLEPQWAHALLLCVDIRDLPGCQTGCHAPTASGLERLPEPLRRAGAAVRAVAQARLAAAHSAALIWWQSQRQWLRSWYVKVLAAGALLLGLATATANIWGVHAINANVLPSATVAVSQALDREVGSATACLLMSPGSTYSTPSAKSPPARPAH